MVRLLVTGVAIGVVVGVLAVVAFSGLDGTAQTAAFAAAVVASMALTTFAVSRPRVARRLYLAQMRKLVGKGELPPPESVPAESALVTAWAAAIDSEDWAAVERLVGESFQLEYPHLAKTFSRERYLKTLRGQSRQFPGARYAIEEIRDGGAELWLRATLHLPERRGESVVAEWWEAWRVDPSSDRVLAIRLGRVLTVAS